jgi:phosphotriesterase-related protein
MSTGRYLESFYEPELWERSTRDIAQEFVREIEQGVDGIRAAVIGEIGVQGRYMSPAEERVHRAAARAQASTGAPITTHAALSPVGLDQLEIFREEGADLRRVAIGHCDTFPHLDYHEAIVKQGAFVEFDTIRGRAEWESQQQVSMVVDLVGRGHLEQILLSHDVCARSDLVAYGGPGYAYLLTGFVPLLRAGGLSEEQVDTILIRNPLRLLTGEDPPSPR